MFQFTLPTGGRLDFPNATDGYWEFSLRFADRDVAFDVNVENGQMTETLFERVEPFVVYTGRFDSTARSAIRVDFAESPDGSSSLYLGHHADEFSDEERAKHFGSRDAKNLGIRQLLNAIHLKRIGLYPDSDDPIAVFDYTIDEDATNYLLSIEFDEAGAVIGISMES